ncbi:hypothetical protein JW899_04660 [Candidatus Uhrbacteria bacterium]|nr:hypothetical protein [Candidatus Uhrbacteria bacterium]
MLLDTIKKTVAGIRFRRILTVLGAAVLALLVFQGGVAVGQKKTEHAYRWNEHYRDSIVPCLVPTGDMMPPPPLIGPKALGGHGLVGDIIARDSERIILRNRENMEHSVVIDGMTVIRRCQETVRSDSLGIGETVTVIGMPNGRGQTKSSFIRIIPKQGCNPKRIPR